MIVSLPQSHFGPMWVVIDEASKEPTVIHIGFNLAAHSQTINGHVKNLVGNSPHYVDTLKNPTRPWMMF